MIIFQSTVKKLDIEINRGIIYLMSDNDKHEGNPLLHADNVFGIRLKKTHGSSESAFWLDSTYESNVGKVDQDVKVVKQSLERGGIVVYKNSSWVNTLSFIREYTIFERNSWSFCLFFVC